MELPIGFIEQMKTLLGDQSHEFLKSYDRPRHYGLRFNDLKGGQRLLPFETAPVPWCGNGRYYQENSRPAKEALYSAGTYYIQEPSAMTPAAALEPQPGELVIDLCAAPGGKTTQLASAMKGEGLIVTNDISPSRVKNLNKNVQISGIRNALVISEDPTKLAGTWQGVFDRVLVDAPCSGEGMFRKEPKLMVSWEEKGPENFIQVQRSILESAYTLLRPGGRLVYSTCTYNLDENEGNIAWLLDEYPDCRLLPVAHRLQIAEGMILGEDKRLKDCGRVWPHLHNGEGHFLAVVRKGSADRQILVDKLKLLPKADKAAVKAVSDFAQAIGLKNDVLPLDRLNLVKDTVYLLPEVTLDNKGLRTFANGWLIGTMKRDRFEPSQAFASGLNAKDVTCLLDYTNDSEDIRRYLKGETISVDAENGWCLVAVEGSGVGWGKVVKGRLKNKLEPSWRWQ